MGDLNTLGQFPPGFIPPSGKIQLLGLLITYQLLEIPPARQRAFKHTNYIMKEECTQENISRLYWTADGKTLLNGRRNVDLLRIIPICNH